MFTISHEQRSKGYKYPRVRFNETKVWGLGNRAYRYTIGLERPNYPVPAIREGFEYGHNLSTGEVVLIEWKQGRY